MFSNFKLNDPHEESKDSISYRSFNYHSKNNDTDFAEASATYLKDSGLPRDISFYSYGKNISFAGPTIDRGHFGAATLYHNVEGFETVVKQIPYAKVGLDPAIARTEIKREAELNKIAHGVGEYYINTQTGIAYLLLKKLPPNLIKIFKNNCPFTDISGFLKFYVNLLKAAQRLHAKNIVHGDLNLRNICMDVKGNITFCDFGLSRKLVSEPEKKPEYTSGVWHEQNKFAPELKNSIPVSCNQDVYTLGMLLADFNDWIEAFYLPKSKLEPDLTPQGIENGIFSNKKLRDLYTRMIQKNLKIGPIYRQPLKTV